MKYAKKLASLLLALAMILGLATMAFAEYDDGSITVRNATVGQTYTVYKVLDLTYSGENVAYSYTKTGEEDALYAALTGEGSPFTLTPTPVENKYNVTTEQDAKTISDWLTANKDLLPKVAEQEAISDTVVFENLDYGYYYLTSSLGALVTVDSTLKDVIVIDKNMLPSWDNEDEDNPDPDYPDKPGKVILEDGVKKIVNSANFGDTIDFNISVNATAYVGTALATHYYISDTLADGFSAAENIVVKVGEKTLVEGVEYTLTQEGNSFEVDIPFGEIYGSNAVISVSYSATVLDTAVIAGEGNLNTANFTYKIDDNFDPDEPAYDPTDPNEPAYDPNDPDEGGEYGEKQPYNEQNKKTTTTYTYALGIQKIDPKGNALTGAEFSVTDAAGNAITAVATEAKGVYNYSEDGTVTQFATDDSGVLIIKGLEAGTYTIKEEIAPDGYNLLPYTVDVTAAISDTDTYTSTITTYYDEDGNVVSEMTETSTTTTVSTNVVPLVVVNNAGTELPSTGGMGTTLFYILGSVLVLAAIVLLVTKKRMSAKG